MVIQAPTPEAKDADTAAPPKAPNNIVPANSLFRISRASLITSRHSCLHCESNKCFLDVIRVAEEQPGELSYWGSTGLP